MSKRTPEKRSWGTHNLHDDAGTPTFFADVVGFVEASADKIKAKGRRSRLRRARNLLAGYRILVCERQKDLACAIKRQHYKVTGQKYRFVHGGVAKVTPHRGEWAVETIERVGILRRPKGRKVVFIWGHRINAAFPPHIRGEGEFRSQRWWEHNKASNDLIERYLAAGWQVRAGGDPNTPKDRPGLRAYSSLPYEVGGGHFDRLASSDEIEDFRVMSRKGSDHPRLWAVA